MIAKFTALAIIFRVIVSQPAEFLILETNILESFQMKSNYKYYLMQDQTLMKRVYQPLQYFLFA